MTTAIDRPADEAAALGLPVVIAPGVYDDMPADVYHADPVPGGSLSCSGAKKLLPPSCPAKFRYEREHPPETTRTFEFGHVAHKMVLGVGPQVVVIDAENYRTKAAQEQQAEARAAGHIPLLRAEHDEVLAMADALRAHPVAAALLSDGGHPESSLFWRDEPAGIMRRCRLDWRPAPKTGRTIGVDYKTAISADEDAFAKAAMNYGYHQQAPWYCDGLKALGLADDDAQFLFIVQEKTAPYLVNIVQLDATAMRIGRLLNRRAVNVYAKCTANDEWPSYSDDVAHISLPYFYERRFEDML